MPQSRRALEQMAERYVPVRGRYVCLIGADAPGARGNPALPSARFAADVPDMEGQRNCREEAERGKAEVDGRMWLRRRVKRLLDEKAYKASMLT